MFAKRLAFIRNLRGYSQQRLADKLNFKQSAISNWESGLREPDLETIINLSKTLEIDPNYLIGTPAKDMLSRPISSWRYDEQEDYNNAKTDEEKDYLLFKYGQPTFNNNITYPEEYKDLPIAFFEGAKDLSQEDIDKVVDFMEFLKNKKK